jgi:hypothetical protein
MFGLMAAPLAANTGNEFVVCVGLPPGTPAMSARLEPTFDPTLLEPIGAAVGRLPRCSRRHRILVDITITP